MYEYWDAHNYKVCHRHNAESGYIGIKTIVSWLKENSESNNVKPIHNKVFTLLC